MQVVLKHLLCCQVWGDIFQFRLHNWCAQSLSHVWLFGTPWTVARQPPLSMGFSRQEYWSGLPFPTPGDRPNPGIEPRSPALQADSLPSEPTLLLSLISHVHDLMDDLSQATYVLCTQKIMLCFGIIPNKDRLKVFKLSNFLASPLSLKVYLNIESLVLHDQKIITSLQLPCVSPL